MPLNQQSLIEHVNKRPAAPSDDSSLERRIPTAPLRIFAGIMAISGTIFVPLAWYPILTPGLVIWIGWLLIAFGKPTFNTPLFWYCSLGINCLVLSFILWLRNGHVGPLNWPVVFIWIHLGCAILGSAVVLYKHILLNHTKPKRNVA